MNSRNTFLYDTVINVNRLGQNVCGFRVAHLRTNSKPADNIKINANF